MSVHPPPSGTLSQKKLDGIYWKTFVGFVNKCDHKHHERNRDDGDQIRLKRREGSFEYMELTARDRGSLQSESESSCSSTEHSLSDSAAKDDKATPMYAVLDMNSRKEIPISDEIAVFDGSPIKSAACLRPFTLTFKTFPASPKCSPILRVDEPREFLTPSPIQGKFRQRKPEDVSEEVTFSDRDEVASLEDNSFDRLESTSPSMEPAPWKDQGLSIQRWMVPHILPDVEDEFVTLPDAVPIYDYDYCHYVPTLEAIMEESEDLTDSREESSRCRFSKSFSYSEGSDNVAEKGHDVASWNSVNDLTCCSRSQDDLFSITSTYGSVGSLRKIGTFENLSFDAGEADEDAESSSDELDRVENHQGAFAELSEEIHGVNELSTKLFPSQDDETEEADRAEDLLVHVESPSVAEFLTVPIAASDFSSENSSSPGDIDASREVIPASSAQSLLESELQSSGRGSPTPSSSNEQLNEKPGDTQPCSPLKARKDSDDVIRRDSGVDDVTSEHVDEIGSTGSRNDPDIQDLDLSKDLIIPGLPDELYIDKEDIPKMVVLFAQEELAKERLGKQTILKDESDDLDDVVPYRKRSATYDPEFFQDLPYSSLDGVHRRIKQIKASDTSRLSTLSSSTPELSAMPDDALLYIPVSYASEAAAKKKKRRRSTMSSAEGTSRGRAAALQTKALISGTGLGNGFNSLRKKLRRSTGNSLRRSHSEKPNLSYSSPDVSSPMARFLNSPRYRSERKQPRQDSPPKVEGRRRGIRSVVSNIFRRLGSRFTFPNRSLSDDTSKNPTSDQKSPQKSKLGVVREETTNGESVSSYTTACGSVSSPGVTDKCVGPSPRRFSSALLNSDETGKNDDFRERSSSVPIRPISESPSSKYASVESDVFESMHRVDHGSLDRTIYV